MTNADIRPEDYAAFKRMADQGRLRLIDAGLSLDPNLLWFNLTPAHARDPRNALVSTEGVPPGGLLRGRSPGDRQHRLSGRGGAHLRSRDARQQDRGLPTFVRPASTTSRARATLFASAGLTDRNGDGMLEDASGTPVRFSILTQADHIRARVVAVIQEQLRQVGVGVDIVTLDPGGCSSDSGKPTTTRFTSASRRPRPIPR